MENIKWHWITSWEEVFSEPTTDLWKEFYDKCSTASVFHHPSMGLAWLKSYRQIQNIMPYFCSAEFDGVKLFYPLVVWRRNWKNIYQKLIVPVGFSDFDYLDPLVIGEIPSHLKDNLVGFFIRAITSDSNADEIILSGIREVSPFLNTSIKHKSEICPQLDLSKFENFAAFQRSLRTSLRGDLNRQQRRLTERGNLSLKVYTNYELDEVLIQLHCQLAFHKQRYPKSYQAPNLHDAIVRSALDDGLLHFSTLMLGNQPVSWHLGFCERNVFYYYLPATHPDFLHFSPGKIHLLYLNQWALEHKIDIFDHLRGEENYKSGWTDSVQKLYQVRINNPSLISRFRNCFVDMKNKL